MKRWIILITAAWLMLGFAMLHDAQQVALCGGAYPSPTYPQIRIMENDTEWGGWLIKKAAADEICTMYVHVREGTFLNGRLAPNLDSEIMMYMGRGFEVNVLQVKNGWALIEGGEAGTCWCCVDYLAGYSPDEEAPMYTVAANGRVRVRQTPDGVTVRYVRPGDTVEVRFVIDGWAYIGDGYVMAEYLTRNK